jgi:hypothetical protein
MRLRRARGENEKWPDYFCEVLLWPYTKEHGNRLFTTLRQNGRTVVRFAKPGKPFKRVMSSFHLFGNAGGVADVLTEEQVRQRYKVLRDIVDVIVEEILE